MLAHARYTYSMEMNIAHVALALGALLQRTKSASVDVQLDFKP